MSLHHVFNKCLNGIYAMAMFNPIMNIKNKSKEEIAKLQEKRLKRILWVATKKVPFYKDYNSKIDFKNFSLNELNKLPIIDKDIIRSNPTAFIREDKSLKRISWKSTSGSSGKPFRVAKSYFSDAHELILGYRAWSFGKNDYKLRSPAVVLRSFSPKEGEKIYKIDHLRNFWYLSPYHINKEFLSEILKTFRNSNAKVLKGYPSSIYILTLLLKKEGVNISSIKTIITSSEMMLPLYRKTIESFWKIKVLDWYGQNERTVTVQQCDGGVYHNNDDYGIIEIDEEQNIIATSVLNNIMPLIRYNTKDKAIPYNKTKKTKKCTCGSELSIPFSGIIGRADDIIFKQDGTPIPTINFYTMMDSLDRVKQFLITQEKDYSIYMQVSENSPIDYKYLKKIEAGIKQRVGDFPIQIKIVDEIERDKKTDKLKIIESKVKL